MKKRVLITGGSGFIGNAIVNYLDVEQKYNIRVLDCFSPQIHGQDYEKSYLYQGIKDKCEIIKADVCDRDALKQALVDVDYIIHLAAETGTGQSMYELSRYSQVNITGTVQLIETILEYSFPIQKIVLASSRAVYGEGMYQCSEHGVVYPNPRTVEDIKNKDFAVKCPICSKNVELIQTTEECKTNPYSFYAYTKLSQEQILQTMCPILEIPYTIFRYQNVYGAGQSLQNPYTGMLSVFSKLLLQNKSINIFEDGEESRDFVHVKDVAKITADSLEQELTNREIINVGSGINTSVLEAANLLKAYYHSESPIAISGDSRKGDIRHNCADVQKARKLCDFQPEYTFEQGMKEFTDWVLSQDRAVVLEEDSFKRSIHEMQEKGMFIKG